MLPQNKLHLKYSKRSHFRPLWQHYYTNSDAVIYVVDSADPARMAVAKEELDNVLGYEE